MKRLAILLWLTAACAEQPQTVVHATIRDSAGIQVIENTAPLWTDSAGWTVDSLPLMDIGSEGDSGEQFGRLQDVLRLPDGRLIVAEGDAAQLRLFSDSGNYIRSVGRKGEGPGEFVGLGLIRPYRADSLMVYDYQLRRITVIDQEGKLGRMINLRPPGGTYPSVEGAM
ncbi:MAG: 6-bladed beta-propeller, partial [Gemmatimonadota bacterium]